MNASCLCELYEPFRFTAHRICLAGKPHAQLGKLDIPDEGVKVHLKGYGWAKVFRFVGKNGRTDYIGTSRLGLSKEQIKTYFGKRWSIEVMHRELKQTCGFGRCQAISGRAGRNHIGLSFVALVRKHLRRRHDYPTTYGGIGWLLSLPFERG